MRVDRELIFAAAQLLIDLIKSAKESNELSKRDIKEIREQLNEEFNSFPLWDELTLPEA